MSLKQMEPTKENIDGINFFIKPFPAFKAANITGELASVLAPLLGALAPIVGNGDLMDVDVEKAADAMAGCSAINGDKLEKLMQKLLLGGHIAVEIENENGEIEPSILDMDIANEVFCGEIQNMFILCFHVIKLNFNGFFKKFAARSGKGKSSSAATKTKRKIL